MPFGSLFGASKPPPAGSTTQINSPPLGQLTGASPDHYHSLIHLQRPYLLLWLSLYFTAILWPASDQTLSVTTLYIFSILHYIDCNWQRLPLPFFSDRHNQLRQAHFPTSTLFMSILLTCMTTILTNTHPCLHL